MVLKTREQLRAERGIDLNNGLSPEFSVSPRQTDFRENTQSEEAGAAFRIDNDVTSVLVDEVGGIDNTPDPDFDLFGELSGTEYERNSEYFEDAFNAQQFDALKTKFHREKEDRATLERGGWSAMGWQFVAGMMSPTNLIPGTLAAKGVKQGYSVAKSATNVGVSGFAATSLSEIALQSSQGLRTKEESLLNIGAGTLFSAGFGAGLAGFANKGLKSKLARKLDEAAHYSPEFKTKLEGVKDPDAEIALSKEADAIIQEGKLKEIQDMAKFSDELQAKLADDSAENKLDALLLEAKAVKRKFNSAGAASDVPTLDDLSIYGRAAAKTAQATEWFNPILRSIQSPSAHARRVAGNLFENPVMMKMNDYADSPAALETKIKVWTEARLAETIRKMGTSGNDGVFTEMRKAGVQMGRDEFRKQVAKAMRRGDGHFMIDGVDSGQPSGQFNQYVMKAAKIARDDLFEHAREELNKVGLALDSKGAKTADTYLTRLWNTQKLLLGEQRFKDRQGAVWNYIKNAVDFEIADAAKKFEKKIDNLTREIDELKLAALRRQSAIDERVGPTIEGERQKLAVIEERIAALTREIERPAELPEELGQLFENIAARILPEDVRVQIFDQIGRNGEPSEDFSPVAKEAAEKLVDDIAGGEVAIAPKSREIATADTPEGKAEIEKFGAVGSKEWAKNKAAEVRRAAKKSKTIDHTKKDDDTLYNLKETYEPEDGISSEEFIDLLHRHPVKGMLFHSLDDGKTWYDPAGLMEQRNLITDGVDVEELSIVDIGLIDRIDAFLESLPDRIYKEDGSLISVNPYGKASFEPIARDASQSGDLLHNFELDGHPISVNQAPRALLDEHGLDDGFEVFVNAKGNEGAPDVRMLVSRQIEDVDEVYGEIVEFEIGTKAGEKIAYDLDNDDFISLISEELDDFGLIKGPDGGYEGLSLSWHSVFDDSLEALGPDYRSSFVSVDGKFYSTNGSLKYITDLPDDPQFSILKHNAEISEFMSHAAKFEPEALLERFAGRQTFEQPKNQPLLGRTLDQIEQDPDAKSIDMGDEVYYQNGVLKTDTPEFKEWFGDSKVVDETGQPLVVYHGTGEKIEAFDVSKSGTNIDTGWLGEGVYLTDSPETASYYAKAGFNALKKPNVLPLYLSIQKPFYWGKKGKGARGLLMNGEKLPPEIHDEVIQRTGFVFDRNKEPDWSQESGLSKAVTEVLKEKGYDGIVADVSNSTTGTKEIVAFKPTQIKSVNNRGTFDPNDPRIMHQNGATNAQGSFTPAHNLLQVARSAVDPKGTLRHEAIHALKSLDLFKADEWNMLETTAREMDWLKKHNIEARYKDQFKGDAAVKQERMLEEAIAEEFSQWRRGEAEVTPEVQTIFERIKSILGQISDALKLSGIDSYNDIFKMIDDGEIAARGRDRKHQELEGLKATRKEINQNLDKLERGEELSPDITPQDVQAMLDIVQSKERPKMPQTLSKFIRASGGLIDSGGELRNMGITPKTHPTLVRPASASINDPNLFGKADALAKTNGARSFDDAGLIAWEEGFFPERPTVAEFLDALGDDLTGNHTVRADDLNEYQLHQDVLAVEDELARLGIDPKKPRGKFARSNNDDDVISAVARILDEQGDKKIAKLQQKINEAEIKNNEQAFDQELDPAGQVDEIVNSIYNKLTNRDYGDDYSNENIIDFGFLKGRTFGIRDNLIEEYLEDDIEHIMRRYTRNVAGQIEMKQRFGNLDLNNHFDAITEEFDVLREEVAMSDKAPNVKEKELRKLDKQEKGVIRDLKFARDKILGRYEHDVTSTGWTRSVDAALSWQYMTSLGGVLATSSLDVFRHPMTQGFGRVFGKALPALIGGNKGLKMNKELARKYAGIAEIINNSRLAHMAGLNDPFSASSPAEIAIQKMTDRFSKLTGLPYWNQFHKEFAGSVLIDRMIENMVKGLDNIKPNEAAWMRSIGLGDMATGAKRLQEAGAIEKVQGIWTINPDKLPVNVADHFFAAVKKEIDIVVVSKGIGDAPLFSEAPIGRMVTQFKSFGAASNQRMLIRGMQDDTGKFVGGLAGMITAGMFVYALKNLEAGREIDDNPGTWLVEGLDRSGIFFLFFEANNIWEKAGGFGAYQAIGAKAPASRFASRNVVGSALGPLFGSANDLLSVLGNGARLLNPHAEFDPTPGDVKSLRRLAPYATLPYWRWLVDGYIVPHMQDEVR